jgi:hypothetical protein
VLASPRSTVRALVAALALGQLALGTLGNTGVLAGAVAAAFLAHGHGHALTLLPDGGHLDVVLHHDDEDPSHGEAPVGFGAHDRDHVVHAAASDGLRDGARRVPLLVALPGCGPAWPATRSGSHLAGSAAPVSPTASILLRTTVLRI